MRTCKTSAAVLAALVTALGGLALLPAADAPAADAALVVVDANGKEHKLKSYKFSAGTRPLGWLAGKDDPKGKAPEALELRDDASLNPPLITGFVTLVPLDRIRSIEFDDKDVMTVKVATDKADVDETLAGSTKYKDINKLTLEAEVDKGDLGVAEVKFLGGVPKGVKSLRFPGAKGPAAAPAGRAATVTTNDAKKTAHKVTDLRPLYKFADGERLESVLMFKKTLKLDVAKIHSIRAAAESKGNEGPEWGVMLRDSPDEETFTLLKQATIDGKNGVLEGLVGQTPVGYKLFPPGTIAEIQFEDAK